MTQATCWSGSLCVIVALALVTPSARADDEVPSFKSRKDQEKKFVTNVCNAVLKAAHFTGQDRALEKYSYDDVKKGRKKLVIRGSYKGAVTKKQYFADITIHLDTSDADAWEVLKIEYSDNNNVPHSRKKVEELIKKFNRKE
jgi:hypothetical protein